MDTIFSLHRYAANTDGTLHGNLLVIIDGDIQDNIPTIENRTYKISKGSYSFIHNISPKFNERLPLLDVPGRKGIRIHFGTIKEHSKGCILVTDKEAMRRLKFRYLKKDNTYNIKIHEL